MGLIDLFFFAFFLVVAACVTVVLVCQHVSPLAVGIAVLPVTYGVMLMLGRFVEWRSNRRGRELDDDR
jgi:hypothetical protein